MDTIDAFSQGKAQKYPYPLETLVDEMASIYVKLDTIQKLLEVAKRSNIAAKTEAKKKQLTRIQYKVGTCKKLLEASSRELDTLAL
jgi:hypothetical protein